MWATSYRIFRWMLPRWTTVDSMDSYRIYFIGSQRRFRVTLERRYAIQRSLCLEPHFHPRKLSVGYKALVLLDEHQLRLLAARAESSNHNSPCEPTGSPTRHRKALLVICYQKGFLLYSRPLQRLSVDRLARVCLGILTEHINDVAQVVHNLPL